jgi:NitT/TauT family transport system substrate-binding protein
MAIRFSHRFFAGALLALSGVVNTTAHAQSKVIFGTAGSMGESSVAIVNAIDKGYFKEAGIQTEVVDFRGGAPALQALIGGSIQYCICAPEHVIRMRSRGIDGVVAFALDTKHTYVLLAREDSNIKKLADLKGKRIGITSPGSLTENLIRLAAKRSHIQVDTDFELIAAGPGASQKAALDTKRIQAGMFSNFDALQFIGKGYRMVYDWRDEVIPSLALLSREKTLAQDPKTTRAVLQILQKSQAQLLKDKSLGLSVLKKIYPETEAALLDKIYTGLLTRLNADGLYSKASFDQLQAELIDLDSTLKPVDFSIAVPTTYLSKSSN